MTDAIVMLLELHVSCCAVMRCHGLTCNITPGCSCEVHLLKLCKPIAAYACVWTAEQCMFDSKGCFYFVELLQVLLPAEAAVGVV